MPIMPMLSCKDMTAGAPTMPRARRPRPAIAPNLVPATKATNVETFQRVSTFIIRWQMCSPRVLNHPAVRLLLPRPRRLVSPQNPFSFLVRVVRFLRVFLQCDTQVFSFSSVYNGFDDNQEGTTVSAEPEPVTVTVTASNDQTNTVVTVTPSSSTSTLPTTVRVTLLRMLEYA